MNHNQKRFVKNSVIVPLIIALAAACVFFIVLNTVSDKFPFTSDTVYVSGFESSEIKTAEPQAFSGDTISKADIALPDDNMIVGTIAVDDKSLELIYNANAVNAVGRFNIQSDSRLAGEVGTAIAECCKANADFIRQLNEGDTVNVNTYYGDFAYEVMDIQTCDTDAAAKKLCDGIGRALLLCTDGDNSVGISDSVLAVVCEMTDGAKVTE